MLEKKSFWFSLFVMMNEENLSAGDILAWYVLAGVDETLGELPFGKEISEAGQPVVQVMQKPAEVVRPVGLSVQPLQESEEGRRPATTELAQATINACKNARELCQQAQSLDELKALVEGFEGCALKLTATRTVFGYGSPHPKLVLVGEAPGADEDRAGIPFVGRSGHLLDLILKAAGFDREKDCYITNVLPWRPPGNRTPTTAEVAVCLPFLRRQIELASPEAVILLGGSAANALLENEEPISRMRGKWLEYQTGDGRKIPAIATFHPAYLLRNAAQKAKIWSDFLRLRKKIS